MPNSTHDFLLSILMGNLEKSNATTCAFVVLVDERGEVSARKYVRANIVGSQAEVFNAHAASLGALGLVSKECEAVVRSILAQAQVQAIIPPRKS